MLRPLPSGSKGRSGVIEGSVVEQGTARPLDGTQVQVLGTGRGALADAQGRFRIAEVPAGETQVRAQRLGYGTQTRSVNVEAGETVFVEFQLRPEALGLDEIVVTGTAGQARRREVGNTIERIDPAALTDVLTTTDDLLQARAPGVQMTRGSAGVGMGAQIRLRGNISVAMSNQPLIYIDGVRARSEGYPINAPSPLCECQSNNDTPSPLNDINPADIERIEIVKGPAATTLYGTEAAAGVIQIFTRRGVEGAASWQAEVQQGLSWSQTFGPASLPYHGLDRWLKNGHMQNYRLSVRGGASGIRYFVSGAFEDAKGILPNEDSRRANLRGNLQFDPSDNLTMEWNTSFSSHDLSSAGQGTNVNGLVANVYRAPNNFIGSGAVEDLDELQDYKILADNSRFTTGLTFTHTPSGNFTNRLVLGYDRATANQDQRQPFGFGPNPVGMIDEKRWQDELITVDYVGSYGFGISSDLRSTLSWGGQGYQSDQSWLEGYGTGFPGPGDHTLTGAANRQSFSEAERVINLGFFGQASFDLLDRYFLTFGLRVDGHSAFGDDFGLQPYPKVSASYVVSDEDFWPESLGGLRLRGAYGWSGRAPGAFDAIRTWQPEGWGAQSVFVPRNVGNPNLGPERSQELELGFESALWEDRLSLDFTFYSQRTEDALFNVSQIPSAGFPGSQLENVGLILNSGIELSATLAAIESGSFEWDIGASVSTNRSEAADLGGAAPFQLGRFGFIREGAPVPVMTGTRIVNAKDVAAPEIETGYEFGPNHPTHILQLHTSLTLPRGIRVAARGEYQGGHYAYHHQGRRAGESARRWAWCRDRDLYERIDQGEVSGMTARERYLCAQGPRADAFIVPWDNFQLRSISLQLPLGDRIPRASNATLNVTVSNVWTWVNEDFLTMHPEMGGDAGVHQDVRFIGESVPPPHSVTASLRFAF